MNVNKIFSVTTILINVKTLMKFQSESNAVIWKTFFTFFVPTKRFSTFSGGLISLVFSKNDTKKDKSNHNLFSKEYLHLKILHSAQNIQHFFKIAIKNIQNNYSKLPPVFIGKKENESAQYLEIGWFSDISFLLKFNQH